MVRHYDANERLAASMSSVKEFTAYPNANPRLQFLEQHSDFLEGELNRVKLEVMEMKALLNASAQPHEPSDDVHYLVEVIGWITSELESLLDNLPAKEALKKKLSSLIEELKKSTEAE